MELSQDLKYAKLECATTAFCLYRRRAGEKVPVIENGALLSYTPAASMQRGQLVNVVGIVVNFKGRVDIAGQLDQRAGLEHG